MKTVIAGVPHGRCVNTAHVMLGLHILYQERASRTLRYDEVETRAPNCALLRSTFLAERGVLALANAGENGW